LLVSLEYLVLLEKLVLTEDLDHQVPQVPLARGVHQECQVLQDYLGFLESKVT